MTHAPGRIGTRSSARVHRVPSQGSTALDVLIQTASNPVIDLLAGDRATATANVREIIRGAASVDGPFGPAGTVTNVDEYGIYFDELSKFEASWKFTRRTSSPVLIAQGTMAGDIVTTRPIARPV